LTDLKNTGYDANTIEAYEFPVCVQKRPSMYIGSTGDSGAHHCIYEVLDNSVDEAGAGHCTQIMVKIGEAGSTTIVDNGRGIPTDIHSDTGKSALELVFCTLHAGGKFGDSAYEGKSGGLNGVGASCVNALSSKFMSVVKRNNKFFKLDCKDGYIVQGVREIPETEATFPKAFKTGTLVHFELNKEIFKSFDTYDTDLLRSRLKQAAFLNPGLTTILILPDGTKESFFYPEGIKEYVLELNKNKKALHDIFFFSDRLEKFEVAVSFQYNDSYTEKLLSFANNISTPLGGTHISAFRRILTKTFNIYAKQANLIKGKDPDLLGDDFKEGLAAVVSVKLPDIEFEGQTKGALNNDSIKRPMEVLFTKCLEFFLDANPKILQIIVEKALKAAKAREAARKAREDSRKKTNVLEGVVNKLKDCTSKKPEECELFVVEGDSAGGSAQQGRNSYTQAILPLKGKVLNTYNTPRSKIYKNNEIANLLKALSIDLDDSPEDNVKKLRYHKIILMSDADPDGMHIECLLLTFLYCHARFLIEQGFVYVAEPPLFTTTFKGKKHYFREQTSADEFKKQRKLPEKHEFKRFKGLGEMQPDELEETAMNPLTRGIKQITLSDLEQSDQILELFLGSDTTQRKELVLGGLEDALALSLQKAEDGEDDINYEDEESEDEE
jgi:DNA gyrase subunit B